MSIASEITRINTNVANAYIACRGKGAVMPQTQNSANLADTIRSIGTVQRKQINFYDYDGTLVYSYTASEAAALTAPPALPVHAESGLSSQGWTHTIGEIITAGQNGRALDVGATYTTGDTSTRLYFFVKAGTRIPRLRIYVTMAANQNATVGWGDGGSVSVFENPSSGAANMYVEKTDYAPVDSDTVTCVTILGGSFVLGNGSTNYTVFGTNGNDNSERSAVPVLIKAELGSNCTGIAPYAFFQHCESLKSVSLPNSVTTIGLSAFMGCRSLKHITIPRSVTTIPTNVFYNCASMHTVVFPPTLTNIGRNMFNNGYALSSDLSEGIASVNEGGFFNCYSLEKCTIPQSVVTIGQNAFNGCYRMSIVDLTAHVDASNIPTLTNVNAFGDTPDYLTFKVANQEMLTAFSNATNWSAYASQFEVA